MLGTTTSAPLKKIEKKTIDHPTKTTALQYILEALRNEEYEVLPEMLQIAREFGAQNSEIWHVLNNYKK